MKGKFALITTGVLMALGLAAGRPLTPPPEIQAAEAAGQSDVSQGAESSIELTEIEREYIARTGAVKVYVMDGMAPIQFRDEEGDLQGVTRSVFDKITELTGLQFEYIFVENIEAALEEKEAAVIGAIPFNYTTDHFQMIEASTPYLSTTSILMLRSGVDASDLDGKIFAGVEGTPLPKGVPQENVRYFATRKDVLAAVNAGKADYTYMNAYSVSYYTRQEGYDSITIVPSTQENLAYSFGYLDTENTVLMGILNTAVRAIDPGEIQNYVAREASLVLRKVTPQNVLENYAAEIGLMVFVIISLLSYTSLTFRRSKRQLTIQNNKLMALSELSNEYFYEYDLQEQRLIISDELRELLSNYGYEQALEKLKEVIYKTIQEQETQGGDFGRLANSLENIRLSTKTEKPAVYKTVNLIIRDENDTVTNLVGKLIDISSDALEKEELRSKAERDGMTRLYNYEASERLIRERMERRGQGRTAALLLLDIDYFKTVNDTLGHQEGNQVLLLLTQALKNTFNEEAIIGRVGGDEFCIYLDRLPQQHSLEEHCQQLLRKMRIRIKNVNISISIGLAYIEENDTFLEAFKHADQALYNAKRAGRGRLAVYNSRLALPMSVLEQTS